MRNPLAAVVMAVAATAVLAACDLGGPDTPEYLNFDAAVVAADGVSEDLEMMHGPGLGLPGGPFPPLEGNRPDCPESNERFHCHPFQHEGLTYERTITYMDAAGEPLPEYDEENTESIRYQISVVGDLSREWWSATIDRQRDLTVRGLLDHEDGPDGMDVVVWRGTGSGSIQRSLHRDDGVERSYSMESSGQSNDVVVPYPRTEEGWPISGTIVRSISITRTTGDGATETMEREVTITFNGTQFVPVTVGDETFTMDLSFRKFGPRGMHGRPGGRGRRF